MNSSRLVSLSLRNAWAERGRRGPLASHGAPSPRTGPSPDDGVHAPHLRRALEDTQRLGQGVALVRRGQRGPRTQSGWGLKKGCRLPEPRPPTPDTVCGGGAHVMGTVRCAGGGRRRPVAALDGGPQPEYPRRAKAEQSGGPSGKARACAASLPSQPRAPPALARRKPKGTGQREREGASAPHDGRLVLNPRTGLSGTAELRGQASS